MVAIVVVAVVITSLIVSLAGPTHAFAQMNPAWTTPLKEGDKVPDVSFNTRVRIESEDQNPFDWKST
jgi:hypothetical protein